MHKPISRYLAFLLLFTLSLHACQKAPEPGPEPEPREGAWTKVHYRAAVSGSAETKATLDAIDRHYLFERDDLLYVVDSETGGDKLYGFLFLISGAGATEAVFEGDLMYFVETAPASGTYEPERPSDGLAVSATLVSQTQREAGVYTIETNNDGKIASGPDFGDHYAATFKDAVRKYSTFTAKAKYGDPSYRLVQGTAFLIFSLAFEDSVSGELALSVTNNDGADNLFSRSFTPDPSTHDASFVAAFPGGTITLHKARMRVTDGGSFDKAKNLSEATLQGNRYYNVSKTFLNLEYFTIQARETPTAISFPEKYRDPANGYGLQYSRNGTVWTAVPDTQIDLAAGESIMLRGKGKKYKNDNGSTTLFTSTAPCYIYGDIMSLFCTVAGDVYTKETAFGGSNNNALDGTFKGMTNLDIHPARPLYLSATTLSNSCYQQMFYGCTGLTRAPEFYNEEGAFAADIPQYACKEMFLGCTALSAAPDLPANQTIAYQGYYRMFNGCTSLSSSPTRLAVTPSGNEHFREMFKGCSSLLFAPELPALEVKQDGCRAMFSGCSSLREAPDLPATTVASNAYYYMFENCSALVTGPSSLPATVMNSNCYQAMFKGCESLEVAPRIDAVTLAQNCFQEMFSDCHALRTVQNAFAFNGSVPQYACSQMFLNCVALLEVPEMSSINTIDNSGCKEMFKGCISLTSLPSGQLPATTLATSCYEGMFSGCSKLATIPANLLPATTLAPSCYKDMFSRCSNLTSLSSGQLPATALAESCYEGMFSNCTKLATIPADLLPATTLADLCYHRMFLYCAFTTLPEGLLPATNMTFGCYWKMFEDCRSLTTVPDNLLPAMNLATACYARMFFRCTSLQRGPILPAINPAPACYFVMFRNCRSIKYVKCMLYLDENHRNGSDKVPELAPYNKTEDPPLNNLRTWTVIDMWTVFNKWLTKSPSGGFDVPNDNTCVYEYNSNMPTSIFSISIAGATLVPSNWTKTPIVPPSTP